MEQEGYQLRVSDCPRRMALTGWYTETVLYGPRRPIRSITRLLRHSPGKYIVLNDRENLTLTLRNRCCLDTESVRTLSSLSDATWRRRTPAWPTSPLIPTENGSWNGGAVGPLRVVSYRSTFV
jgi:hypothetical protein